MFPASFGSILSGKQMYKWRYRLMGGRSQNLSGLWEDCLFLFLHARSWDVVGWCSRKELMPPPGASWWDSKRGLGQTTGVLGVLCHWNTVYRLHSSLRSYRLICLFLLLLSNLEQESFSEKIHTGSFDLRGLCCPLLFISLWKCKNHSTSLVPTLDIKFAGAGPVYYWGFLPTWNMMGV